jgi:hypothetical protein
MSPSKRALLPRREGAVTVSIGTSTTMRKILYFFGWENGCAGRFLWVKPTLGVDFGDVVAGTTHANVPLRCQSWERVTWMSCNIDLGVNFRLMRWDWKAAIWGGGRESGSFVLSAFFIVAYVEHLWVFLILWREILECSPYLWAMCRRLFSASTVTLATFTQCGVTKIIEGLHFDDLTNTYMTSHLCIVTVYHSRIAT